MSPARKRTLPSAEARFRLVVESAPNALIMSDEKGVIVLVNPQAERLFGYAKDELLGRPIETLVPRRLRRAHETHRAAYGAAPSARAMGAGRDLYGQRKDGTQVPVEIGLSPMKTPEGLFVLASIIDITERRALEKRLAQTEALAAMGSMIAVVSHEIRNPLGSIVMAAEALTRGGLSEEDLGQVMSVLVSESQRLNRTLGDFLLFSRPHEPRLETGDLNTTVREVLAAARSDAKIAGGTRIVEALAESIPPFAYDPDQLRQVLWNIIRNAFQALEGKGRLEITTEVKNGKALIHVSDDGPGIPTDVMDKIFTPFFTTKAQGTGLGLPISRNILAAHGGDLTVESAPGRGARFTVMLPLPARP